MEGEGEENEGVEEGEGEEEEGQDEEEEEDLQGNIEDKKGNDKNKKRKTHDLLEEKISYEDMKKIKKGNSNNSGNNSKVKLYSKNLNYLEKSECSNKSNKFPVFKREKSRLFIIQNPIFEKYLSTELCDMHFHEVIKNDTRLFFDYFCDKLKHK